MLNETDRKTRLMISVNIIRLFYKKKIRKKAFFTKDIEELVCICACVCVFFNCLARYTPTKTSSAQSHRLEGLMNTVCWDLLHVRELVRG